MGVEGKKYFPLRLAWYDMQSNSIIGATILVALTFEVDFNSVENVKGTVLEYAQVAEQFLMYKYNAKLVFPHNFNSVAGNTLMVDYAPSLDTIMRAIYYEDLPLLFKFSSCLCTKIEFMEGGKQLSELTVQSARSL